MGWTILRATLFCAVFSFLIGACASDGAAPFEAPMGGAMGKTSEIVVVADKNIWEGAVGDTFRYYFGSAYLILPQPEPIFDLRHYTPEELKNEPLLRDLRTYVLLGNFTDEYSTTSNLIKNDIGPEKVKRSGTDANFHTVIGHNKWAIGQMLVYIFGASEDALMTNIKASFPVIAKRVNEFDKEQVGNLVYFKGRNKGLENLIREKLGVQLQVPRDYFLAIEDDNTFWIRKETGDASMNIFIQKLKYSNAEQLTKKGVKEIRDAFGKKYVSTEVTDSLQNLYTYMRTNDVDLPMFEQVMDLNGNYAVEVRGIWDIVNDFMGGPFIGYLIHNKSTNDLIYVEGFVHAPRKKKRKFMQHLEHTIRTTQFTPSSETAASTDSQ